MSLLSHIVDTKISHLLFRKFLIIHDLKHNIHIKQYKQKFHFTTNLIIKQIINILSPTLFLNASSKALRETTTTTTNRFIQTKASGNMEGKPFLPKKALVLRKFSRLEYERLCHPNLSEEQLATNLSQRGSVYESLKHYDHIQKSCLKQIESVLKANNIEYQTVDRFGYNEEKINWADVIITNGGDGTFLMAASKVVTRDKPVIGINSDPTKSVGHLCLPSKYSNNFDQVIELLKKGKFQWQYKQRLRVTLIGEAAEEEPRELNDIRYNLSGMNQFLDQDDSQDRASPARSRSPFQHALYQQLPGPSNCKYPAVLPPNSTTTSMSQTDIAHSLDDNSCFNLNSSKHHHQKSPTVSGSRETTSEKELMFQTVQHGQPINCSSTPTSPATLKSLYTSQISNIDFDMTDTNRETQPGFNHRRNSFRTVDGKVVYKIRQLKERALNEVFVGETLSARVSYYEFSVDNNRLIKMKSSGLTVCTGTGSTSWYYNINKITEQQIKSILEIINKVTRTTQVKPDDTKLIGDITRQFNETLTFQATEPIMAYSIRDPVDYATAPSHNHRGYAKRIEVKSRMQNACLVLDGCQFYPFNDGSYTLIEIYDEDALKTINLD